MPTVVVSELDCFNITIVATKQRERDSDTTRQQGEDTTDNRDEWGWCWCCEHNVRGKANKSERLTQRKRLCLLLVCSRQEEGLSHPHCLFVRAPQFLGSGGFVLVSIFVPLHPWCLCPSSRMSQVCPTGRLPCHVLYTSAFLSFLCCCYIHQECL